MAAYKEIERSIITRYRKSLWRKFTRAINEYDLIKEGDRIAVCISGGKDSMLLAKLMQEIHRHGQIKFDLEFLVMDPGYNEKNLEKIIENSKILNIPIKVYKSDIFEIVDEIEDSPCYLCARMRRGYLYSKAQELGCNKIALGHHFDDVIETILLGMLYGSQIQTMMPKLRSKNFKGMELIRPMYLIKEEDIIKWANFNNLSFIDCACKVTDIKSGNGGSKRDEMKALVAHLRSIDDSIDFHIFRSVENVNLETVIRYKKDGKVHHFLDEYDKIEEE
ncbi:MAG: tRNA 2-thiocytidine biosynthesis protein TtcA [Clostridiales bacterium]|nr:tRNA 2-thiocytidine biosynthesis protein TtcA [Clostridiales bacterium]